MKIIKEVTEVIIEKYELDITEEYIARFNHDLSERDVEHRDFNITLEDITTIFNRGYLSPESAVADKKIKIKGYSTTYEDSLSNFILDWLNEDLDSCDGDIVKIKTLDIDKYIKK